MGGRRIGCSAFSEQRKLISKILTWAEAGRPPGPSLVAGEGAEWAGEWLGTTMFFGQAGEDVALQEFSFAELRLRDKKTRTPHFVWSKRSRWILHTAVAAASQSRPAALPALAERPTVN